MAIVDITSLPSHFDPRDTFLHQHFLIIQSIYQTLVRISESGDLVGDLAESWQVKESGTLYEFKLTNANFHDGTKVQARDVAYSISRHFHRDSESIIVGYLSNPMGQENRILKPSEILPNITYNDKSATLQFKLEKPYPPFLYVLSMIGFSIVKEHPTELIGSGPLTVKNLKSNKIITLERNTSYVGPAPKMTKLILRKAPTLVEIQSNLTKGDTDMVIGAPMGEITRLGKYKEYVVEPTGSLGFHHLFFNMKDKRFQNDAHRTQLSFYLAQEIKKGTTPPFHEPIDTYLPHEVMPRDYYSRPAGKYDLTSLTKAWKGQSIKIIVRGAFLSETFTDYVATVFTKIGIKPQIVRVDTKEFVRAVSETGYDMIFGTYVGNFPDPDGFLEPLSVANKLQYGRGETQPLMKEINEARYLAEPRERLSKYQNILRTFESKGHFVPLYRTNIPIVRRKSLGVPGSHFRYESELWRIFWLFD